MTHERASRIAALASLGWMALIFGLSSLPGGSIPVTGLSVQGHFVLYAVLGGLYFLALFPRLAPRTAAIVALTLASLYGITDEFHQSFVPGRTPQVSDWLVDTLGAALAVLALWWAMSRRARLGKGTHDGK
jgi:VanZ family protein